MQIAKNTYTLPISPGLTSNKTLKSNNKIEFSEENPINTPMEERIASTRYQSSKILEISNSNN